MSNYPKLVLQHSEATFIVPKGQFGWRSHRQLIQRPKCTLKVGNVKKMEKSFKQSMKTLKNVNQLIL